jgi:EMAP domain
MCLDLNIGNENRTIVSGIRDSYTETELVGRKIVIIRNLKPANIRSITSNGMLLATEYEGKTYLLTPPEKSKPGDKVTLDDLEIINQEISIEEFKKYSLQTQREGNQTIAVLYHKGRKIPLKVNDENIVVDDKVPEGLKIK